MVAKEGLEPPTGDETPALAGWLLGTIATNLPRRRGTSGRARCKGPFRCHGRRNRRDAVSVRGRPGAGIRRTPGCGRRARDQGTSDRARSAAASKAGAQHRLRQLSSNSAMPRGRARAHRSPTSAWMTKLIDHVTCCPRRGHSESQQPVDLGASRAHVLVRRRSRGSLRSAAVAGAERARARPGAGLPPLPVAPGPACTGP